MSYLVMLNFCDNRILTILISFLIFFYVPNIDIKVQIDTHYRKWLALTVAKH